MKYIAFILSAVVSVGVCNQYRDYYNNDRRSNRNSNGFRSQFAPREMSATPVDCYDLCSRAYYRLQTMTQVGCRCSSYGFDMWGDRNNRRGNQRMRATSQDCYQCPPGTVCEVSASTGGVPRCIDDGRNSRRGVTNNRRNSRNPTPRNTGLPRRLGGYCGYLSPVCQASRLDLGMTRYTYDYTYQTCVRVRTYVSCTPQGRRNNMFTSLSSCNNNCVAF